MYLEDVMLITRAYARAGTVEGAIRKVSLLTCQRSAGRSAEPAWMTVDGLIWDKKFKHVFVESPQPKGSKIKLVALGAGESRHSDWFLALGDYLVLQPDRALYKEEDPNWLFPELQKTSSPGTTLGNYIKAVLPAERGGHKTYQKEHLVVHELPPGVTAGGLRPGACNELRAAMPSELAMHVTAHDFTSFAAYFEYIDCTRAGCMPGSVVLGGWEPFPWGQMGKGTKKSHIVIRGFLVIFCSKCGKGQPCFHTHQQALPEHDNRCVRAFGHERGAQPQVGDGRMPWV